MDAASVVVFAPKEDNEGSSRGYRGLDAWLISFEDVLAVRYGLIRDWNGTCHAPRPLDFEAGAWEVQPSSWLMRLVRGTIPLFQVRDARCGANAICLLMPR